MRWVYKPFMSTIIAGASVGATGFKWLLILLSDRRTCPGVRKCLTSWSTQCSKESVKNTKGRLPTLFLGGCYNGASLPFPRYSTNITNLFWEENVQNLFLVPWPSILNLFAMSFSECHRPWACWEPEGVRGRVWAGQGRHGGDLQAEHQQKEAHSAQQAQVRRDCLQGRKVAPFPLQLCWTRINNKHTLLHTYLLNFF